MRTIDGDRLANEILEEYGDVVKSDEVNRAVDKIYGMVINSPTITADRPQGKWIDDDFVGQYRCSECDYYAIDEYDYCPNCGAKMKGADDE